MNEGEPKGLTPDELLDKVLREVASRPPLPPGFHRLLKEDVEEVLGGFSERERVVIQLRFGLVDGRKRTLKEVGEDPGIDRSKSTVWRIEQSALGKLRNPVLTRRLRDYLE